MAILAADWQLRAYAWLLDSTVAFRPNPVRSHPGELCLLGIDDGDQTLSFGENPGGTDVYAVGLIASSRKWPLFGSSPSARSLLTA
jgi:hypothetical protein